MFASCDKSDKTHAETSSFLFGLHGSVSDLERIDGFKNLGVGSFRQTLTWSAAERKGAYNLKPFQETASAFEVLGMRPLWILYSAHPDHDGGGFPVSPSGRAAYVKYAAAAARAFPAEGQLFEVWNEWNIAWGMPKGTPPGDPAAYVALLKETRTAIKAENPGAIVLGGGMAGAGQKYQWLEKACQAGLLDQLDGLSFHPYSYWMGQLTGTPEEGMLELVNMVRKTIDPFANGRTIPLYVTEVGWPTHVGHDDGITPETQAKYLARGCLLLRAQPDIKGVWWFTAKDHGGVRRDPKHFDFNFGFLYGDGSPKPALDSFNGVARLFRELRSLRMESATSYPMAYVLRAEFLDGTQGFVCWTTDPDSRWCMDLEFDLPVDGKPKVTLHRIDSNQFLGVPVAEINDRCTLRVTCDDMPIIVRGLPQSVTIADFEPELLAENK